MHCLTSSALPSLHCNAALGAAILGPICPCLISLQCLLVPTRLSGGQAWHVRTCLALGLPAALLLQASATHVRTGVGRSPSDKQMFQRQLCPDSAFQKTTEMISPLCLQLWSRGSGNANFLFGTNLLWTGLLVLELLRVGGSSGNSSGVWQTRGEDGRTQGQQSCGSGGSVEGFYYSSSSSKKQQNKES